MPAPHQHCGHHLTSEKQMMCSFAARSEMAGNRHRGTQTSIDVSQSVEQRRSRRAQCSVFCIRLSAEAGLRHADTRLSINPQFSLVHAPVVQANTWAMMAHLIAHRLSPQPLLLGYCSINHSVWIRSVYLLGARPVSLNETP